MLGSHTTAHEQHQVSLKRTWQSAWALFVAALMVCSVAARCAADEDVDAFPGVKSTWRGFDRYDFEVDGRQCLVVTPKEAAPGRPWIWRARFFDYRYEVDLALVEKGYHLVYMDVGGLFGSPKAVQHGNVFYDSLTSKHAFAEKVALSGTSRGGLMIYNWAAQNPEKVACIYGDAAVIDFKSWPAGTGNGIGNPTEWSNLLEAYGMTEKKALSYRGNPIDNLEVLAKAGVPLMHLHGNADHVVPLEENALVVAQRYAKLGGEITLIIHKETDYHEGSVHAHIAGLEDPSPIVAFIVTHSLPKRERRQAERGSYRGGAEITHIRACRFTVSF